jgi:hypothetical protein
MGYERKNKKISLLLKLARQVVGKRLKRLCFRSLGPAAWPVRSAGELVIAERVMQASALRKRMSTIVEFP